MKKKYPVIGLLLTCACFRATAQADSVVTPKKTVIYFQTGIGFYTNGNFNMNRVVYRTYREPDALYTIYQQSDQGLNSRYSHAIWPIDLGISVTRKKSRMGLSGGYGLSTRNPEDYNGYLYPKQHLYFANAYFHYTLLQHKVIGLHVGGLLRYENFSYQLHSYESFSGGHRSLDLSLAYNKIHFNPLLCVSFNTLNSRRFFFEIKIPLGDVFYSAFDFDYTFDHVYRLPDPDIIELINDNRHKSIVSTDLRFSPYIMLNFHFRLN